MECYLVNFYCISFPYCYVVLSGINTYAFLDGCKSVCGEYGSLWPRPTKMSDIGSKLAIFNIEDLAPQYDTSHLLSDKVTYLALRYSMID